MFDERFFYLRCNQGLNRTNCRPDGTLKGFVTPDDTESKNIMLSSSSSKSISINAFIYIFCLKVNICFKLNQKLPVLLFDYFAMISPFTNYSRIIAKTV